jgi:hypothetical protein
MAKVLGPYLGEKAVVDVLRLGPSSRSVRRHNVVVTLQQVRRVHLVHGHLVFPVLVWRTEAWEVLKVTLVGCWVVRSSSHWPTFQSCLLPQSPGRGVRGLACNALRGDLEFHDLAVCVVVCNSLHERACRQTRIASAVDAPSAPPQRVVEEVRWVHKQLMWRRAWSCSNVNIDQLESR